MRPLLKRSGRRVSNPAFMTLLMALISVNAFPDVWIGMSKVELLQELGPPDSTLAVGDREIHRYGNGQEVEFSNDRVSGLSGFPSAMVGSPKAAGDFDIVKASTAYAMNRSKEKRGKRDEFVNFESLQSQRQETFTLSSRQTNDASESGAWMDRIKALEHKTIAAAAFVLSIAGLAALIRLIATERPPKGGGDGVPSRHSEEPPVPQSNVSDKPVLRDARFNPKEAREKRLSIHKDPDSMGLSIRGPIYQEYDPDFDPSQPRRQLVGAQNGAKSNAAYSHDPIKAEAQVQSASSSSSENRVEKPVQLTLEFESSE